jgi:hypothetical protein
LPDIGAARQGLEGTCNRRNVIMVSTMKTTIALGFAVAVGAAAATPAPAQTIMQEGNPGFSAGFPFAHVNAPGPNGQCWVMSDRTMGYGYWGKCPEGVAAAQPTRRTQRQARATTTTQPAAAAPAASTGFVAAPAPAAPIVATAPAAPIVATAPAAPATAPATTAPATVIGPATTARAAAGPVITESFPFAYVSSPAPDGQCWVLSDRTMGYGYWGKCP